MRALVVYPGCDGEVADIEPTASNLQAIVRGYLEGVMPSGGLVVGWHAYVNEYRIGEGNLFGTLLARMMGWPHEAMIVGPIVFLGDGPAGTEADVPEFVLEASIRLQAIARRLIKE